MAEELNVHFSSVFTREEVVASKINNMKENKSPGVDGLSPKILKETVEQISKPLAHVFNMSLQEGIVPVEWKEANIIPLFKKGSRNKSVNYRPVSLTSVTCKLLETIIRDHMMVSSWKSVLSGVPQGSVLGPILFLVYINDLEEGVTGNILKFADDTKLFTKTKEIGDKQNLQDDIDKLVKWSEKWQMLFNFGKCKCLHIGPGNTSMNYEMGGTILSTTVKEKDLGVTMNANMKVSGSWNDSQKYNI